MWLRLFVSVAALACFIGKLAGQDTIANPDSTKEWQVKYDPTDITHFPRSHRLVGDIRLHIYEDDTGALKANIRLFKPDHSFLAKSTVEIELQVEGDTTGRKRYGFWNTNSIPLSNGGRIDINGIWQHGLNTKNRASQRIQFKWHYHPHGPTAPAPAEKTKRLMAPMAGGCDDDPDSDVLEEGDTPPGDQDPPPDPTPPC